MLTTRLEQPYLEREEVEGGRPLRTPGRGGKDGATVSRVGRGEFHREEESCGEGNLNPGWDGVTLEQK